MLDVVGASGNQGSGGELIHFRIGELHDTGEDLFPQISADPCTNSCSHIADANRHCHHGECDSDHLSAGCPEVIRLNFVGIQSGCLVALHGIGNAHGLHKGFAHGIKHSFKLTPHLGAGFFSELSSLLHCCKERTNVHASDGSLVAVVVLFGAFKRREGYAHALPDVGNGHGFQLFGCLRIALLLLHEHFPKAVFGHHGHLVIQQDGNDEVAVELFQVFFGEVVAV